MNQFEVSSSSNSEQEEQQLSKITFYNDDAELLVFSSVTSGYPAEQAVHTDFDGSRAGSRQCVSHTANGCHEECVFYH